MVVRTILLAATFIALGLVGPRLRIARLTSLVVAAPAYTRNDHWNNMLGWNISVYRLIDSEAVREALRHPADEIPLLEPPTRERIAVWQTGFDGLDWIDELVESRGVTLREGGYPSTYLLRAGDLVPHIAKRPPSRSSGEHDFVLHSWEGTTTVDEAALGSCDPSEWLLVEVVEAL